MLLLEKLLSLKFFLEEAGKNYAGCFKKSFTTLKAYINLIRVHVQCFELS
jgi:hypothetical protein